MIIGQFYLKISLLDFVYCGNVVCKRVSADIYRSSFSKGKRHSKNKGTRAAYYNEGTLAQRHLRLSVILFGTLNGGQLTGF